MGPPGGCPVGPGIMSPEEAAELIDRELIFELPNDLQCIEDAVEFVVSRCSTCQDVARKLRFNFRVSLVEALSNAMIYGNGRDPAKRVRLEVRLGSGRLTARVTDQGRGFNPLRVPDPTTPDNLLEEGGRGLFLMRKLMDEVHYNDRGNSVTLILHLAGSGPFQDQATA